MKKLKEIADYLLGYPWPRIKNRAQAGEIFIFPLIAINLLVLDGFGLQVRFVDLFKNTDFFFNLVPEQILLYSQIHFWIFCLVLFVLIPAAFSILLPAEGGNHFGFSLPEKKHWYFYGGIALFMLPVVFIAAGNPAFQNFYPMLRPAQLSTLLIYEAFYMTQFFCVEFFFRGPILFRLEKFFGYRAIFMMIVPYALIHIHKPFPEAVGSIFAGFVLGYFAIKGRSIWPGVFIHCWVALSMDFFSLLRSGLFFQYLKDL